MRTQPQILTWMHDSLSEFIAQLSLSKSKPTVDAYRYDIGRFLEYLYEKKVRSAKLMKPTHVIGYLTQCKDHGKSSSSVNRYYMAIRSYCTYLRKTKVITLDLTEDVTPPRYNITAPYIPTIEEINAIMAAPNIDTESGTRDKAILELLYSSGLRASELCDLKIDDYREGSIIVRCGKRGKIRTIPLTESAGDAINDYVARFRGKRSGPLFQTITGKAIRRQLLHAIVVDYAHKARVKDVTTHTLRHACATHLLDQGADLRLIQEVLGHSSIASTQRYTHLSSTKMNQMFQQFHPRKMRTQ